MNGGWQHAGLVLAFLSRPIDVPELEPLDDRPKLSRSNGSFSSTVSSIERDVAEAIVSHWKQQFSSRSRMSLSMPVLLCDSPRVVGPRVLCVPLSTDDVGAAVVAQHCALRLARDDYSNSSSSSDSNSSDCSDSNRFREESRSSASSSVHEAPPSISPVALDGDAAEKVMQAFLKRLDARSERPLSLAAPSAVMAVATQSATVESGASSQVEVIALDESCASCAAAFRRRMPTSRERDEPRRVVQQHQQQHQLQHQYQQQHQQQQHLIDESSRVNIIVIDDAARAASARFAARLAHV
jgi:hypothetical protein